MYVIINNDTGKYTTPPGSERSYTDKLQDARTFATRDAAERECCGNERIVPVLEALHPPT